MDADGMDNSQQSTTHSQTQNNEMVFVSMSADEFLYPWKKDYLNTWEHPPEPGPEPVENFPDARRPSYVVEGLGMGPVVFIKRRTAAAASGASSELKTGSDLKHDDSGDNKTTADAAAAGASSELKRGSDLKRSSYDDV